MIQPNLEHYEA